MRIPGFITLLTACCSLFGQSQDTLVWRLTPSADAVISSLDPEANYGRLPELLAQAWENDGTDYALRMLLRFEWPSLPPDAAWISASLSLVHSGGPDVGSGHAGDNAATLQGINGNWSETMVSWSNQPVSSLEGAVFLPASTTAQQDYGPLDVTDWVFRDQSRGESQTGFILQLNSESALCGLAFASREHPDSSRHPVLELRAIASPALGHTPQTPMEGSELAWLSHAPGSPSALRLVLSQRSRVSILHTTMLGQTSVVMELADVPAGKHQWPLSGMLRELPTGYLRALIDGRTEGIPMWYGP